MKQQADSGKQPTWSRLCWRLIWAATLHCDWTLKPMAPFSFQPFFFSWSLIIYEHYFTQWWHFCLQLYCWTAQGQSPVSGTIWWTVPGAGLKLVLVGPFQLSFFHDSVWNPFTPRICYPGNTKHYPGDGMGQGLFLINLRVKTKSQVGRQSFVLWQQVAPGLWVKEQALTCIID